MFYSVIVPCFNSEKTILRALKSIETQTFKDYEVVVVDDGSIDLTAKIVKEFCDKSNLNYKYIFQENEGPSVARNNAVNHASGDFLAFLDADEKGEMIVLPFLTVFASPIPVVPVPAPALPFPLRFRISF